MTRQTGRSANKARLIIAPFAGAGGGCLGAHALGLSTIGLENDRDCCATRAAAGLATIRQDVTLFSAEHLRGRVDGLIGSPPCTDFSRAGRRMGLDGETGPLVWEPLRLVRECLPEWVVLEQVDMVLPIWHEVARILRELGYSAWVGILDAADYGVPQNRKRAILIARKGLAYVRPPEPTHSRSGHSEMFAQREKWVSMAEALGWTDEPRWGWDRPSDGSTVEIDSRSPAPTVLGRWPTRWAYGQWLIRTNHYTRRVGRPSPTVTGNVRSWVFERPATTICSTPRIAAPGHHESQWDGAIPVSSEDAGTLQGFPDGYPFQGNKTSISRQIGNAFPPLFAQAIIAAASGITIEAP